MHLPPAAALRHFEQQRRPRPRLLPEGGRRGGGAGRRWKVSDFSSKWDRSERIRFSGQHSTFHLSLSLSLSRICKPTPELTRKASLATEQQHPTRKHTHRHQTRAPGRFCNLQCPGYTPHGHVHVRQRGDPETPPPQFADSAKGCSLQSLLSSWLIGTLLNR